MTESAIERIAERIAPLIPITREERNRQMKCCAEDAFGKCKSEKIEGFLLTADKARPLCRYHSKGMSVWMKAELLLHVRLIEEAEKLEPLAPSSSPHTKETK